MKCEKCGHEWNYKGNLFFVTCPNCMRKIKNVSDKISSEE